MLQQHFAEKGKGFTADPEAMASLSSDLAAANAPMSAEEAVMGMPAHGQTGGIGSESGGNVGSGATSSGYGGGESGDVGGGGDGDTVICTELYRQGLMPTDIYEADCAFGASLDSDVMEGYQLWGKPVAHAMSKSKLLTMIAKPFVLSWANHMAYGFGGKRTLFGRFALTIGVPICRFIGRRLNKEPQVAVVG